MLNLWIAYQHYILAGSAFVMIASALVWLLYSEYRKHGLFSSAAANTKPSSTLSSPAWLIMVGAVILIGAVLRVYEIDLKTMTHVEVYTPNIDLPADISMPPPRHGFVETLRWHFLSEPHPVGYYMGMWAWTKVFGTSLTAVRITSAILGIISIWLTYRIATLFYNRQTGIISAAILAASGFHMYWSQLARMYVPGCFLGLLSIFLLYKIYCREKPEPSYEIAYILTIVAGVFTQIFFWPFFGMQLLWVLLTYSKNTLAGARIIYIQTIALILSFPAFSHIVLMTRQHHTDAPTLDFLVNYFSFGFVIGTTTSHQTQAVPYAVILLVFLVAIVLLIRGFMNLPGISHRRQDQFSEPSFIPLVILSAGVALFMFALSYAVADRVEAVRLVSVLPLFALILPPMYRLTGPAINAFVQRNQVLARWLLPSPIPLLAIVPTLVLFVMSFWISVIAPRAFTIFIPYLLIVIAIGIAFQGRSKVMAAITGAVVAAILTGGVIYYKDMPYGPRNYQLLAQRIDQKSQADDLFFVKFQDWVVTPMFYYLNHEQLVAKDYSDALQQHPQARIWVFNFQNEDESEEIQQSLESAGYVAVDEVRIPDSKATLFKSKASTR